MTVLKKVNIEKSDLNNIEQIKIKYCRQFSKSLLQKIKYKYKISLKKYFQWF